MATKLFEISSKENTALRAGLLPHKISVIPNAIDTSLFTPDVLLFHSNPTTLIVLCRLVYRKGVDLLVKVIPDVCKRHKKVRILIGESNWIFLNLQYHQALYWLQSTSRS